MPEVNIQSGCSSSGNMAEGYCSQTGAQMTVCNSSSDGDKHGCGVIIGGQLTMDRVTVDGFAMHGSASQFVRSQLDFTTL